MGVGEAVMAESFFRGVAEYNRNSDKSLDSGAMETQTEVPRYLRVRLAEVGPRLPGISGYLDTRRDATSG